MKPTRLLRPILSFAIAGIFLIWLSGAALADSGSGGAQPFLANGVGVGQETSSSAPGCQFGSNCVVESKGTADVIAGSYAFLATYDSVITIDYSKVVLANGGATFCAPATGEEVIRSLSPPKDRIYKSLKGQVCGGTGQSAPHTFVGTFTITGGTGRFAHASGSGKVTATDNGTGTILTSNETGTITFGKPGQSGDDDNQGNER